MKHVYKATGYLASFPGHALGSPSSFLLLSSSLRRSCSALSRHTSSWCRLVRLDRSSSHWFLEGGREGGRAEGNFKSQHQKYTALPETGRRRDMYMYIVCAYTGSEVTELRYTMYMYMNSLLYGPLQLYNVYLPICFVCT